jgi:DNA-binding GntR family transcriptional regulator
LVSEIERPPTLRSAVVDAIRDAIYRGEICPGEPLREMELTNTLKVSRSTIREALQELQENGLVEIIPHRGAFVRELTRQMADELYTLRALIEPYAVGRALENQAYSEEDLKQLGELGRRLDKMEEEGGPIYDIVKADAEFHHLMCSRSHHQLLLDTFNGLQALTWLFLFNFKLYQSEAYKDDPTHYEMAKAIQTGDPAHAAESVKKHIESAGVALLERMDELALRGVLAS